MLIMSLYFHFWIFIDMFQTFSFNLWCDNVWSRFKKSSLEIKFCLNTHASTCWISTTKCTKKEISSINSSTCISKKTTSLSLKKHRNVININENSNASLKKNELNNDEMKYEKKTKSWNALCDYFFCYELTFLRKSFFCDSKLNFLFVKIYLKDIFIFLKNIFTCFDIHTTNIFMTKNYHDYHFRKSITNRYLL